MRKMMQFAAAGMLGLFVTVAQAEGSCDNLTGNWGGSGNFKSGILSCEYTGSGTVDGADSFTAKLHLEKKSGGRFCIGKYDVILTGTCANGALVIDTSEFKLNGSIQGDSIHLGGQLISPIEGEITINVTKSN